MVSTVVLGVIVGCGSFAVLAGSLIYAFIRWRRRDQVTMALAVEDEQNQPAERPQTTGNVIRDGQDIRPSSRSAASVATDRMRGSNAPSPQRISATQPSIKPLGDVTFARHHQ